MSNNYSNPWAAGPSEILRHALSLLENDNDVNRRIAMILIDNSVEQMMKTYLSLPKRVSELTISRKKRDDAFANFPSLLDTVEEFASSKLEGIDLGVIEWYHHLRNELYHQGFGLTVEREKVEIYAELAKILFKNLFGQTFTYISSDSDKATLLGRFLENWNNLDEAIMTIALGQSSQKKPRRFFDATRFLLDTDFLDPEMYGEINEIRKLRNEIVHNQVDYRDALTERIVERVSGLANYFEEVLNV